MAEASQESKGEKVGGEGSEGTKGARMCVGPVGHIDLLSIHSFRYLI